MRDDIDEILVSEAQIRRRVAELGARITAEYRSRDLVLLGMLNGAAVFTADLMRRIDRPLRLDFAAADSYGRRAESGRLHWRLDGGADIAGRHVLVVEDIVDTGKTLQGLVERLGQRKPAGIRTCALLNKPARREIPIDPDYVGFEIPDRFAVGYGLDFAGFYRNLPFIGALKEDVIRRTS